MHSDTLGHCAPPPPRPLCTLFLFSLFVSVVTVKLTRTVWGKYQNLNQALLLHTPEKHRNFRGSDDRFK